MLNLTQLPTPIGSNFLKKVLPRLSVSFQVLIQLTEPKSDGPTNLVKR
jgi:hypothetical protein